MNEYALLFRMDVTTKEAQPSPEQMEVYMRQWMEWINDISSQKKLANGGNHFLPTGRVLRGKGHLTEGPYTINNESVAGYILILAGNIDEAKKIASQCPILKGEGTSVEIRQIATPEAMNKVERTTK